jgi:hypothetical protein
LAARLGTAKDRGVLPALWLLALPAAYSLLASPSRPIETVAGNFGRYFFPLFAPLVTLGMVAIEAVLAHERAERSRRLSRLVQIVAIVGLLAPPLLTVARGASFYGRNVRNVEDSDVRAARWINARLDAHALIAAQDVGAVAYFTPNPLLDLAGIVSPEILPYVKGPLRGAHQSGLAGLVQFLGERRVRYLAIFPRSYPGLLEMPGLELAPLARFPVADNVTMAGNELVVFEVRRGSAP